MVACKCGCGREIPRKRYHKWYTPKYLPGHYWIGRKRSEENKQNLRKPKSELHKEHMRKPKSELHKQHMRKPKSEEHKRKIGDGNRGKIVSEETRRKSSETKKRLYREGKIKAWVFILS